MKKYQFLWLALLLAVAGSCTGKFEDCNTNPSAATQEMMERDNLLIGSFVIQMQKSVFPVDPNSYQRAQNLTGDIFGGYFAATNTWNGGRNNSTYAMFDEWNRVAFGVSFTGLMPNWLQIKKKAEKTQPDAFALAQIIKIANMHRTTDIYGPLPYSDFGTGGLKTKYDSQESIYRSFFNELNVAIDALEDFLEKSPGARPLAKFDLIYGGDYVSWLRFANSLKLRLAMRIVYVDPAKAKQYAEEAVNSTYGVITGNAGNALLKDGNGVKITNPLEEIWNMYDDTRMSANMESFLTGYNDPRLPKYFNECTYNNYYTKGGYHGVRTGIMVVAQSRYTPASTPNIYASTPIQWMAAAEIYFLRAEGAMRGWNMGGTAGELYNEGIKASFEQHGAGDAANYTGNATAKPAEYKDPYNGGNRITATSPYLSNITVKWDNVATQEQMLERIITQKWIAMYPDGQEAWSEFRRTGYPKIFPVVTNHSDGVIDTQIQVRRAPFPQSEYEGNAEEVKKAEQLLGGKDTGGTKLWWDKKVN